MNESMSSFIEELKSCITVNDLLQVWILDDPNSATYYSRVNDITEGKLVIAWPTSKGMRLLVHEDQILEFTFLRIGIPHTFRGLVDGSSPEPLPEITIILSSPIKQVQRRQDFRVKCLVPIEVLGNVPEGAQGEATSALSVNALSNDLSAGGISVLLDKRVPENSLLHIRLLLPDKAPPISIPCAVIYSENQPENQTLYRTGMKYLAVSAAERARIVRFLYRTQLQGLRT
jgi:c-di-GMP-binding flagellar brake protein YcgR